MKLARKLVVFLGALLIASVCYAGNLFLEGNTQLDRNWGKSYETAKCHQILNPNAGENLRPVTDIEGRVAERIMEEYFKGAPKKKSSSREIGILSIK
jgi:hypothetical protein